MPARTSAARCRRSRTTLAPALAAALGTRLVGAVAVSYCCSARATVRAHPPATAAAPPESAPRPASGSGVAPPVVEGPLSVLTHSSRCAARRGAFAARSPAPLASRRLPQFSPSLAVEARAAKAAPTTPGVRVGVVRAPGLVSPSPRYTRSWRAPEHPARCAPRFAL
eukprot:scaffold4037_cov400-Prasinococcus_capsulatus_cf.AAC.1